MENQELLSQNDDLVREQTDMIRRLEERLGFYEGEAGVIRVYGNVLPKQRGYSQ